MTHDINMTNLNGFIPVAVIIIAPLMSHCDQALLIDLIFFLLLMDSQSR